MNGEGSVLVVGATGLLGSAVCRRLRSSNEVRALVRPASRAKADPLGRAGMEIVSGDLRDPATLVAACRGVETVVSTATAIASQMPGDSIETVDRAGQLALIDAAEKAGVRRFVFVSFPGQPEAFPLQNAKRAVEERLQRSALDYAILQPTLFQEVWLSPPLGFDFVEGRVRIYGSGEAKLGWIAVEDVAEAAVVAARSSEPARYTATLVGPEALSPNEVVAIFEEATGRKFLVERVPAEALRAQLNLASDPRQQSFFALAVDYSRGGPVTGEGRLPAGRIRVRDYASKVSSQTGSG
jgi:uncharacterized protein YbjT (DUF2867 family)